ncbi:hypothetical protein ABH15_03715 [Methanoculleus taiwanensis]|uniref:Uncharacterized protein n=1 Tax=Methanoculleus taiwanensis TaxID=1550565 RepID=A0A498H6E6_9EURY|nr:hypothetical protein [Methanoculleus taiwanensis]RXE57226.1 hypothetical protein ABH15_03715 [Methanoculleus taiwanensis]
MKRGSISTGTATISAITIAAVLMTVVAAGLLVPGGETAAADPALPLPVETVAGYAGTPVVRISGTENAINLTNCRIYLIDPEGTLRDVHTAILRNTTLGAGETAYIFRFPVDDEAVSGYWITDEQEMVFTAAYLPAAHPFSPAGRWRIVVYDQSSLKNRIDQVFLINGPVSPG